MRVAVDLAQHVIERAHETPRFCEHLSRTGDLETFLIFLRPCRTSWLIVGMGSVGFGVCAGCREPGFRDSNRAAYSTKRARGGQDGGAAPTPTGRAR